MTADPVTFFIPHRIGTLAAEEYVRQALRSGAEVFVVCPGAILAQVEAAIPEAAGRIRELETLTRGRQAWHRLHGWLTVLLEKEGPYHNPRLAARRSGGTKSWRLRCGARLARLVPKLEARRLNRFLGLSFRVFLRNPFPTRRIAVVSYPPTPFLLCARGQQVHTIIESWDHPVKKSAGYPTHTVVAWNRDIGADWERYQGAERVLVGYPMKLHYALESRSRPPEVAQASRRTALYAIGTTALRPDWYADELKLIETVCRATRTAGWKLLVKPKPNGDQPGIEELAGRFEHVTVGSFGDGGGALDYYLDRAYNERRLAELRASDLVINTVTTFCLDAASAGWPVLQIDVTDCDDYPALSRAMSNYHLRRYIVDQPALCLQPNSSLEERLVGFLQQPDSRPQRFRDKLRRWLVGEESCRQAVDRVVRELTTRPWSVRPRRAW